MRHPIRCALILASAGAVGCGSSSGASGGNDAGARSSSSASGSSGVAASSSTSGSSGVVAVSSSASGSSGVAVSSSTSGSSGVAASSSTSGSSGVAAPSSSSASSGVTTFSSTSGSSGITSSSSRTSSSSKGTSASSASSSSSGSSSALTPQEVVKVMPPGWNLGNSFDGDPTVTSFGNPAPNQTLIDAVHTAGFNTLRLPVTWTDHIGAAPTYTIDPAWMAQVEQTAQWAVDAGMYVFVNTHHEADGNGGWVTFPATTAAAQSVAAEVTAVWKQIATAFQSFDSRLMLECFNE